MVQVNSYGNCYETMIAVDGLGNSLTIFFLFNKLEPFKIDVVLLNSRNNISTSNCRSYYTHVNLVSLICFGMSRFVYVRWLF